MGDEDVINEALCEQEQYEASPYNGDDLDGVDLDDDRDDLDWDDEELDLDDDGPEWPEEPSDDAFEYDDTDRYDCAHEY